MRITYKGDYALKSILDLALYYGKIVTIHDLAKRVDAPVKFLEQVLLDLKRGGFVESKRGKVGGYFLAKAPAQISVADIIRYIDGPIEPIGCAGKDYKGCKDMYKCVFRKIWCDVTKSISDIIDNIDFEDLVKQLEDQRGALVYSI
ncbi:MAG: Rrf2 family transcriptional regulator [Candidatus Omnitrophota bacterium]